MLSYWDILPCEIQEFILRIRNDIISRERKEFIRKITDEELYNELYRRKPNGISIYKSPYYVIFTKILDQRFIMEIMELGINLNTYTINGIHSSTVQYYMGLCFNDRVILSKEIINNITIDIVSKFIETDDFYIYLGDWIFEYLKEKWNFTN